MTTPTVTVPNGMVCVTTWGSITMQTVNSLLEMRTQCERDGLKEVAWTFVPGALVDRARNQAVTQMLTHPSKPGWLLFVDGDCVFPPDALKRLLHYAFVENPACDVVGAWNPLRGEPYLPTIDTGTGTWESHFPGAGALEVMRTGAAFVLTKRHVYEAMPGPWYGTRQPLRPIDVFLELDNFATQKFDGHNPLALTPEWQTLYKCAQDDASTFRPQAPDSAVGEDSNFCDHAKALGFHLYVHTDVVCGHVDQHVISWEDHKKAMSKMENNGRLACGVIR